MKIKETATIISQEKLCRDVYSMWISTMAASGAEPGQFVSVYTNSEARLLPRPISICETDKTKEPGMIRLVYRVAGEGTKEFSQMTAGDRLEILGPNGNGFPAAVREEIRPDTRALLIGGGIGIPPMLQLAKELKCDVTVVAGYRTAGDMFLTKELEQYSKLYVATDDASCGYGGTVTAAVRSLGIKTDIIFACGPRPMLAGVKDLAAEMDVPAYVSMEERMACGIGACLGCVCDSVEKDEHLQVNKKRVCVEGPVFSVSEVRL